MSMEQVPVRNGLVPGCSVRSCTSCSPVKAHSLLRFGYRRGDGYVFYLNPQRMVRAGCRTFTKAGALRHWGSPRYHRGAVVGRESVRIVKALFAQIERKKPVKKKRKRGGA